ncbi:uncharacterized protein LOC141854391 [Brevipalpus obovatus]|uniref:uncharacterized protein LOC141854391 n=1 Tax=Brevipalpus obovatus TaxID=246614 RepID=UPI003D9F5D27
MNLCKPRTSGGISARTKSLREKFSSKRSYSELTFKDSTTSLTETTDLSSFRSPTSTVTNLNKLSNSEEIRMNLPKTEFNAYNLLPEEAYCSALDINCSDTEPRFPWQRDAAIQCDLDDHLRRIQQQRQQHHQGPASRLPPASITILAESESHKKSKISVEKKSGGLSSLSSLRFWKSSSPLNPSNALASVAGHGTASSSDNEKKSTTRKRLTRSMLHRAASFDSKGYSRLMSQPSVDSPTIPPTGSEHLYVPSALSPSHSSISSSGSGGSCPPPPITPLVSISSPPANAISSDPILCTNRFAPSSMNLMQIRVDNINTGDNNDKSNSGNNDNSKSKGQESSSYNSAPGSRSSSPTHGQPNRTIKDDFKTKRTSQKRRIYHKSSNSAPDSLEERSVDFPGDDQAMGRKSDIPDVKLNFQTMQELFDLKVKTKASSPGSDPMDKQFLLSLPSTGLTVHGKDVPSYMNLPSPNVHAEGQESNTVFKKLGFGGIADESEQEDPVQEEPPASALHRRRALVPPKLITDGYESCNEDTDHQRGSSPQPNNSSLLSEPTQSKSRRRSSIVVIPPMQICPGDLLVYSKVLNHRNEFLENFDGSTQCLAVTEDASRKNKNTWSLLKLFDRSNRTKSDSLCGLEEVLSTLTPSVFIDEQLAKYKGITWSEFETMLEERRGSSIVSGHRLSHLQNESRRSSGQSSTASTVQSLPPGHIISSVSPSRPILLRTQTFDTAQSNTNTDDNYLATNAHSTRSNSCIAPVSTSIRRLSGGIDLKEEPSIDLVDEDASRTTDGGGSGNESGGGGSNQADITNLIGLGSGSQYPANVSPPALSSSPSSTRSSFAITRSEFKRREALWDLFQSESVFLYCHLMVLKNVFMEPLKKIQVEGFAMFAEPEVLFGNLDELCCVTYAFCKEFLSLILQQMNQGELNPTEVLIKLFQKSSKATALTQAYHRYTLNYINALNYLETLRRQVEFNEFEKWCSRDPRCKKLQLQDLLVSPVQHIMRVPLILKDIEMRTEDQSEREHIGQILESEEASLRELDDKMKWLKNFERLLEIQRNIVWPSVFDLDPKVFIPESLKGPLSKQPCERLIVSPRRQIIIEGPLNIFDSGKPIEMWLVLFDDMLIITRRKKGLHKKQSSLTEKWANSCSRGSTTSLPTHESLFKYVVYKQPLSLDRFYIHDISPSEGAAHNLKYAFVLVCLNRFQQIVTIHTFQAPNESVKINWLSKLKDTTDKWKRTLQNTVFRNQQRLSSASVSTTASYRESSTSSR